MNKVKVSFIFTIVTVFSLIAIEDSFEVGRYDGGEYCDRMPGLKSSDRPGQTCSCQLEDELLEHIELFQGDMNFQEICSLFPIFKTKVHDHPFIYFDSASTAQMPQEVLDAMIDYYQNYKSNVGRGLYQYAEHATYLFERARAKIAHFIGAKKEEIVFTSGATASINLVAQIWAKDHIFQGDEIIVSEVEHNANFVPWQQLALKQGLILKIVPLNDQGTLDLEIFKSCLSEKTKLVAITHQSNILGTTNDVKLITSMAHAVGAKVLVDAAQSIAHQKIDIKSIGCDFLGFSGHKLFGPTGVGVLFIKSDLFDQCVLQNFGGGIVLFVSAQHTDFKTMPYALEPGTQAIAQVIGLGAAIDFVQKNINFDQAQEHETQLARNLAKELESVPGVTIISPIPKQGQHNNMVTFTVDQCHAYDVAEYLDLQGIAVRAGFHCAQPYHDKLGGKSSVRVSFSIYNTQKEVDFLLECLKQFLINF